MNNLRSCQEKAYCKLVNYKIEIVNSENNCVAIYISSNGIYYPDTVDCFNKTIFEKDRYEFTRLKIKRASKHIFIRDVYKHWYVDGINININSIDKIIDWLKIEVDNFKEIIIVGISGGGYLSALLAPKIKASIVLCMNGQWDLTNESPIQHLLINRYPKLMKYLNIAQCEYDYSRTFYFVSEYSSCDKEQLNLLRLFHNIHIIKFRNTHHGVPFLKCALPVIMNMTYEELCKLERHKHLPFFFEIQQAGIIATLKDIYLLVIRKIKQWVL